MSIKTKDNQLSIKFNSLQQYLGSPVYWTGVKQRKDGETSGAELKLKGVSEDIYSCVVANL